MMKPNRELELTIQWKFNVTQAQVDFKKIESPSWLKVDLDESCTTKLPNEKII